MRKKPKIFVAAQDPGGWKAIWPVVQKLKKKFLIKIFLEKLPEKTLIELFKKEKPDLVFTATSLGDSIEKKIIKVARVQKIKTVSLIDFWSSYKLRFGKYLPDYILVIDEIMKKEMAREGFDPQKLVITGSPCFDAFKAAKRKGKFITFFSQPFSELGINSDYNEMQVFEDLVAVLEKLRPGTSLKIKFHPREKKLKKFDKIIKKSILDCSIVKTGAEDLIKKSKLVLGMNSVALFQAAMMGKTVLSYQPNLKGLDPLISNRFGLSTVVYKKKDLAPAFKKMISVRPEKKNLKIIKKYTQNNSTQKVINFITKLLKNGL